MESMANPAPAALLRLAQSVCSTIINMQIGSSALQEDARELMGLLMEYKPSIPAPGTRCGCGSGAVRLRDGEPLCFSCWMSRAELPHDPRLSLRWPA